MPIFDKSFLGCNVGCTYCYEHPIRPEDVEIDKEAVEKSIWEQYKKIYGEPKGVDGKLEHIRVGLHGGEPLFRGKEEVEFKLKTVFEKDGKTAIQTNGILIDDDFIECLY
jgi:sulfatase maturation enzyme AslB (radical SAM superfamily)